MAFINEKAKKDLIEKIINDPEETIFFIGSGLSARLFPMWKDLLLGMLEYIEDDKICGVDKKELVDDVNKNEGLTDVAQLIKDHMTDQEFNEILSNIFNKKINLNLVPESYKNIFKIEPKSVITTNFDMVPNILSKGEYVSYTHLEYESFLSEYKSGRCSIYKYHGCISKKKSIILTSSQYADITQSRSTEVLRNVLSLAKNVIFLGYSFSDPDINQVLGSVRSISGGNGGIHFYALVQEKDECVKPVKRKVFEKTYGIKFLVYENKDKRHEEVDQFTRDIIGNKHKEEDSGFRNDNTEEEIDCNEKKGLTLNEAGFEIGKVLDNDLRYRSFMVNIKRYDIYISIMARSRDHQSNQRTAISIWRNAFNFTLGSEQGERRIRVHIHFRLWNEEANSITRSEPTIRTYTTNLRKIIEFRKGEISEREILLGSNLVVVDMENTPSMIKSKSTEPFSL